MHGASLLLKYFVIDNFSAISRQRSVEEGHHVNSKFFKDIYSFKRDTLKI